MEGKLVLRVAAVVLLVLFLAVPAVSAATPEQIEASVVKGLAWLATQQSTVDGSWDGNPGVTGLAVLKFEDRAKETMVSQDPFDPAYQYKPQVEKGLDYLFSQMQVDGSNIHIQENNYYTSIALMAVAASNNPAKNVGVAGPVNGMTYQQVAQGMVNWLVATQQSTDSEPIACEEGGWGYGWTGGAWADQSNTGYSVLGLAQAQAPAPDGFGILLPPNVATRLLTYTTNSQVASGGSLYNPCWEGFSLWVNILKTGTLIQEFAFAGVPSSDPRVTNAVGYIEDHWGDTGIVPEGFPTSYGWLDSYQAMFTMMKGFEAYQIEKIFPGGVETKWFDKVSDNIIAHQNLVDGSFSYINPAIGEGEESANLRAAWALLTLEKAVPPVLKITIVKTADPMTIYQGEQVTYTYEVTNNGNVDLTDIKVTDDQAGVTPAYDSGDDNHDNKLNPGETWIFIATTNLEETTTNTATATGLDPQDKPVISEPSKPVTVTVIPNRPPDVSKASASLGCLWPPNNKYVDLNIIGVSDPDGDPVTITITKITSDEATATDKGSGGPKNAPDATIGSGNAFQLRAERSGTANGRVYEVTFKATDGKPNGESIGTVTVKVPHDQSAGCVATNDGQKYLATEVN